LKAKESWSERGFDPRIEREVEKDGFAGQNVGALMGRYRSLAGRHRGQLKRVDAQKLLLGGDRKKGHGERGAVDS